MPRLRARVDRNHAEVVFALRGVGAQVCSLAQLGHGVPDLAVGFNGRITFLEVKQGTEKLTPDEERWHRAWAGLPVVVVRSPADALRAIGITVQ